MEDKPMRKSTKLILAAVMVCFAIMAVNSNCVFADDAVEKKILKNVNRVRRLLNQKVLPRLGSVPKTGQTTSLPKPSVAQMQQHREAPKENDEMVAQVNVSRSSQVRRLTPTECERLQSFPDGWTLVDTPPSEMRSR